MVFLCLVVITNNPDSQTICVGDTAVMNCGYTFTTPIIPIAVINGKSYIPYSQPIAGLPLQFILPANDTNAIRIIIGPVGEQFIGMTNFSCRFAIRSPPLVPTVVLTVLG